MRRLNPWFITPVLVAAAAGALIGRNVARVSCAPVATDATCSGGGNQVAFAIIGAIVAAIGVAIVVALVIRSLAEWRHARPPDGDG